MATEFPDPGNAHSDCDDGVELYDEGEGFSMCDGQVVIDGIDWDGVTRLAEMVALANDTDCPDCEMANLVILDGMYGADLDLR